MISPQFRAALALRLNGRFFYGWAMLGFGALGFFASGPGQSHTFSVFITPISADLGISRTALSTAYAAATLVAALGLPYVGRLVDRFGVRLVVFWIGLLLGASALAFGRVTNLVLLALGFAALRFFGQGALMLNCSNLVVQWFSRKRGFALSLMALGFSLSMAVHPPLAQWLTDQVGWREAWFWLGIATWALLLPLAAIFIQNKPEDLGLSPDGAHPHQAGPGAEGALGYAADIGSTLKQATRTPAFWIIAVSLSAMSLLVTGMFFHQVSILGTQGLSAQFAARVFVLSAATMVLFMPLLGHLLDRFPTQPVFAAALLLMGGALIALAAVSSPVSALVYGFVFGLANAALHTHLTFVWPKFFGRKHLASIQGAAQMANVVGSSLGPLPFGLAYDLFGSYTGALVGFAVLPAICAAAVLSMRAPAIGDQKHG